MVLGIRDKWARIVMNFKRRKEMGDTLRDFIGFVKEKSNLVNETLFSKSAIDHYQKKKATKNKDPKR